MNLSQSPTPLTPARKRRRIQLACNTCRDRKTKCNAGRPACSSCVRRGVEASCVYEEGSLAIQREVTNPNTSNRGGRHHEPVTPAVPSRQEQAGPNHIGSYRSPPGPWPIATASPVNTRSPQTSPASHPTFPIYSGSSNDALVSQVQQAASKSDALVRSFANASNDDLSSRLHPESTENRTEIIDDQDISYFVLPQRQTADEFLRCYWEFLHPVFPVLHRSTFIARYEKLWIPVDPTAGSVVDGNGLDNTIFHASLNLVFALGCQFTNIISPIKRPGCADEFYQRSRKLVNFEILDSMEFPLIQMLLLTGIYLQSTEYVNRCWNVVGLAIRAAQGMGLPFDNSTVQIANQLEREMRRRVWHVCVHLDRLLAMTFGRPTMVTCSWDVKNPSIIDDEYLLETGEGTQPANTLSRMSLFVYSSQLFDIMDEILSTFYLPDSRKQSSKEHSVELWSSSDLLNVLNINSKLDRFSSALPDTLKPEVTSTFSNQPWSSIAMLQSRILHRRVLYTRILLLRPIFLTMTEASTALRADSNNESRLDQDLAVGACALCVKTADMLLEDLHENLDTAYRSPGWHTVYCETAAPARSWIREVEVANPNNEVAFAAGTILIAAHICPLISVDFNDQTFQQSWSRCVSVLGHHRLQIKSAERAIGVLEALKERVRKIRVIGTEGDVLNDGQPVQAQSADLNGGISNLGREYNYSNITEYGISGPNNGMTDPMQFDIASMGLTNLDSFNDAWFTQQLGDFDWLNSS